VDHAASLYEEFSSKESLLLAQDKHMWTADIHLPSPSTRIESWAIEAADP